MAAMIWKYSHVPLQLLESNIACITFGQPLVRIPLVQSVIQKFERFKTTIHSVMNQDDILPRLLRYLTVESLRSSQTAEGESSPAASPVKTPPQLKELPTVTLVSYTIPIIICRLPIELLLPFRGTTGRFLPKYSKVCQLFRKG